MLYMVKIVRFHIYGIGSDILIDLLYWLEESIKLIFKKFINIK